MAEAEAGAGAGVGIVARIAAAGSRKLFPRPPTRMSTTATKVRTTSLPQVRNARPLTSWKRLMTRLSMNTRVFFESKSRGGGKLAGMDAAGPGFV